MSSVATLVALQDRIRRIERPGALRHGVLPFEVAAIDEALPGGGLALGAVHEFLGIGADEEDGAAVAGFAASIAGRIDNSFVIPGCPAGADPEAMNTDLGQDSADPRSWVPGSLAPLAPRNDNLVKARGRTGIILWCLKRGDLYAPGLAEHGLDPARIVRVIAPRDDGILWVLEEGLRTSNSPGGIAAVVGEIGRLPMVAGRRLQLAAERSGVTALLLRRWRNGAEAASERERPSAAVTRWRIAAIPSLPGPELNNEPGIGTPRWRVELLRCRGAEAAQVTWDVEVADASGLVSIPAGLADRPAAPRRLAAEPGLRRAAG